MSDRQKKGPIQQYLNILDFWPNHKHFLDQWLAYMNRKYEVKSKMNLKIF